MTYHSWQRRSAFVALSIVVPVVANGMRAYAIIILAHLTQNRIAVGIDHLIYGWVFFAVIMLLLFLIGGRWREAPKHRVARAEPLRDDESSLVTARLPVTAALVGMLAVCPPLLSATVFADVSGTPLRPLAPSALAPWTPATPISWKPAYAGADTELIKSYAADRRVVQLYVAYYGNERQGAELVNADNRVDDGKQWRLIGSQTAHARLGSALLPVREETIRSRSGQTRLAWTWYWVAGQYTLSPVEAKLLKVKSRLLRRPYNAAAIVLATEHAPNFPAQAVLQDFLDHCPTCNQLVQVNGSTASH
jgi:EpsI family protein